MHVVVFYIATLWLALLIAVGVALTLRARTILLRVLGLELVTTMLVGLLALFAGGRDSPHYLDAALVLALLSFVGTLAAARFDAEGRIF
ncbi:monovalent cation/H+ antiporter complex subunit F [Sphaerobacter thermophilus]|jgi:multicomponent Na+:H+ antiporter subunit F|uniref:Multiple resistance and pH regulation protein F n=1 Tax=Sphaerobacter thermophilus (strain ATCC 49802 / DSM 20745 / KCCM 41009 / NCIMB 13125 / S 6022) TaxID=479434 RepID=D1C3F5_SPHTD|nr:monovalent cation/H+ antiporter complex subunit F [Sphaerobacter thermophilus]ACZ38772.1 multiple resistance and pH regulation protein F [Sphaerobacter thermophilus DSM 20745]PZN67163.1 MAG: pH regulation protein F [Sphaerobacter thermophilus]